MGGPLPAKSHSSRRCPLPRWAAVNHLGLPWWSKGTGLPRKGADPPTPGQALQFRGLDPYSETPARMGYPETQPEPCLSVHLFPSLTPTAILLHCSGRFHQHSLSALGPHPDHPHGNGPELPRHHGPAPGPEQLPHCHPPRWPFSGPGHPVLCPVSLGQWSWS